MDICCSKNYPKVSIIVATFKRDITLKRAIESLVVQTYSNIEIIVVDDNADIKWNNKVKQIIQLVSDSRVVYIQNTSNEGSARTRNIGIENATGEYITFLDDDDVYDSLKIELQLSGMIKSEADYSLTDLTLYNEDGSLSEYRKRKYLQNVEQNELMKYHFMYHMTGTDTMMFTKKYLQKIGCFDEIDVGDEFYLMQKAILNRGKLYYCPECEVKAYIHTGVGGLSSGQMKIDGENDLYRYKMSYFDTLDKKAIRYIKMRHYAVISFAYLRVRKWLPFLKNGICCFLTSPIQSINLILKRKR